MKSSRQQELEQQKRQKELEEQKEDEQDNRGETNADEHDACFAYIMRCEDGADHFLPYLRTLNSEGARSADHELTGGLRIRGLLLLSAEEVTPVNSSCGELVQELHLGTPVSVLDKEASKGLISLTPLKSIVEGGRDGCRLRHVRAGSVNLREAVTEAIQQAEEGQACLDAPKEALQQLKTLLDRLSDEHVDQQNANDWRAVRRLMLQDLGMLVIPLAMYDTESLDGEDSFEALKRDPERTLVTSLKASLTLLADLNRACATTETEFHLHPEGWSLDEPSPIARTLGSSLSSVSLSVTQR